MPISREEEELIRARVTDPSVKIEDMPRGYKPPILATIRDVDVDGSGNLINAQYTAANFEVNLEDAGGLEQVLLRLARGNPPFPMPDKPQPQGEFKTPLSLKNEYHVYVIMRLSGKNWQFSADKPPFSTGLDGAKADAYFHARKVDRNGQIVKPGDRTNRCIIAFFIADSHKIRKNTPEYSHGFNFHLDLKYKDWEGNDSYMPIIIDPDVRYPGGSGNP